jgi:threonine dehydrogenase-like Zn-dependent dehydrogenase
MLPSTQYAIQLIGPDQLQLVEDKPVDRPGPYQVLARVEAVGLCFSDLKLLKQFSDHARKSEVLSGIDRAVLPEIPSYRPGTLPTVPGHEAVCTIVAVGNKVRLYHVGQRVLVETDYRWLPTAKSNAAFGYNFEGGLQQYVLMDERVIVDPQSGEGFLIPVSESLSASAIALVEPWACVESSYVSADRNRILAGGRLLVVIEAGRQVTGLQQGLDPKGRPGSVTACCAEPRQLQAVKRLGVPIVEVTGIDRLAGQIFDDIVYFGADKRVIEVLNDRLAPSGVINIVLGGQRIGQSVSVGVGRVHYGLTRWIGTTGHDASESYQVIPADGEIRDGERAVVFGAAGPMGQMHVIRLVCAGKKGVSMVGTDVDPVRLETLAAKARPLADRNRVTLDLVDTKACPLEGTFGYFAIMVPMGAMVEQAVQHSSDHALINVFAGIPSDVRQDLDLDRYIAHRCYMFGTSGSRLIDMKIVLDKVTSGQLDTNVSVDAVSGMAGAIDGIRAVENRLLSGKIIVYPSLADMPLTPLGRLSQAHPAVATNLRDGLWTKAAEEMLLNLISLRALM